MGKRLCFKMPLLSRTGFKNIKHATDVSLEKSNSFKTIPFSLQYLSFVVTVVVHAKPVCSISDCIHITILFPQPA